MSFFYRILSSLLFLVLANAVWVEANVLTGVSFSWKSNPPDDYVVGYRLYYGSESRFYSGGALKSNFSYDYYIDFAEFERCVPNDANRSCKILTPAELQCENLNGSYPRCSVFNLHGHLYFALTAYSGEVESGYTKELRLFVNPGGISAVQQTVSMLLLQEK